MRFGCRGDMGFMEAMLSMMAVVLVLMAYLGSVASTITVTGDPVDPLEDLSLEASMVEGTVILESSDDLPGFIARNGYFGICVTVSVPFFSSDYYEVIVGSMEGDLHTRSWTGLIPADGGRSIVAVYGVTVCR